MARRTHDDSYCPAQETALGQALAICIVRQRHPETGVCRVQPQRHTSMHRHRPVVLSLGGTICRQQHSCDIPGRIIARQRACGVFNNRRQQGDRERTQGHQQRSHQPHIQIRGSIRQRYPAHIRMGEGRKDYQLVENNTTTIARQPSEDEMDNIPRPTHSGTEGAMDNEYS